ncbi:hypothetical protein D9619_003900 [Psilocybe cf. subviscida]|uniref:Uncharacterized protein n=1 Tax=Psilocybe cf. subviscida TaxID=2480587 RepID=A0A8H5BRJ4_9AGAR|nr:hypothetical protein D9619_003900 [Psilocybe cf. subviscida]
MLKAQKDEKAHRKSVEAIYAQYGDLCQRLNQRETETADALAGAVSTAAELKRNLKAQRSKLESLRIMKEEHDSRLLVLQETANSQAPHSSPHYLSKMNGIRRGGPRSSRKDFDIILLKELETYNPSSVNAIIFSSDGKYLLSGGDDEISRRWASLEPMFLTYALGLAGGYYNPTHEHSRKEAECLTTAPFSFNDPVEVQAYNIAHSRLAIASHSGEIKVYSLEQFVSVAFPDMVFKFRRSYPSSFVLLWPRLPCIYFSLAAALAEDSTTLLINSLCTGHFDLYHLPGSDALRSLPMLSARRFTKQCCFLEGSARLSLCGSDTNVMNVVDVSNNELVASLQTGQGTEMTQTVAASPKGAARVLLAGASGGSISIWKKITVREQSFVEAFGIKKAPHLAAQSDRNLKLILVFVLLVTSANWAPPVLAVSYFPTDIAHPFRIKIARMSSGSSHHPTQPTTRGHGRSAYQTMTTNLRTKPGAVLAPPTTCPSTHRASVTPDPHTTLLSAPHVPPIQPSSLLHHSLASLRADYVSLAEELVLAQAARDDLAERYNAQSIELENMKKALETLKEMEPFAVTGDQRLAEHRQKHCLQHRATKLMEGLKESVGEGVDLNQTPSRSNRAEHSLSPSNSQRYWRNDSDDEAVKTSGSGHGIGTHAHAAPSPSAPRTLPEYSPIVPIFVLGQDMKLTISTRYIEAKSSTGNKAYVVFNGPVKGPFYNWPSADMSIRAMEKKGASFKGFQEIGDAHNAWDRFLHLGNDGLPNGMPRITKADTQLAERMAASLCGSLESARPAPSDALSQPDAGVEDGEPTLRSLYAHQDSRMVRPSSPSSPLHPSSHAGASSITQQIGAPKSVISPVYIVILAGERPGVYSTADDNIPLTEQSEIVDTLAAANQRFVTAYMANLITRTYAAPRT